MPRLGRAIPARNRHPSIIYPSFDTVGAGTQTLSGATASQTHVIKGNCIIAVAMAWPNNASTTITCGGVAMNTIGLVNNNSTTADGGLQVFSLMNPPTGSQTVSVSFGSAPSFVSFNSVSYFNVGQVGTWSASAGTTSSVNLITATAPLNSILVNALSGYAFASATQGSYSGNGRYVPASQGTTVFTALGDTVVTGSTSQTFSITYSVSGTWNVSRLVVPLLPILSPQA